LQLFAQLDATILCLAILDVGLIFFAQARLGGVNEVRVLCVSGGSYSGYVDAAHTKQEVAAIFESPSKAVSSVFQLMHRCSSSSIAGLVRSCLCNTLTQPS
jgi:hypothetical protein